MAIQNAKKTSLSKMWVCQTKSALDRNLNAKANSKNPMQTFTTFIHPPDFGREVSQLGKMANSTKGTASASENPNEPTVNAI